MRWPAFALVMLVSCSPLGAGLDPVPGRSLRAAPDVPRLEHAHRIDDEATWRRLAARPDDLVVAQTEVVKLLIDLQDGERIWFVDTVRWPVHYDFARRFLSTSERPVEAHDAFNQWQYRTPDRRFVLASLVHYLEPDIWTLELIAGDNLEGERVLRAFEHVRSAVFFGDRMRYRPLSQLHDERIAPVRDRLPIATTEEVFAGVRYQPLTRGIAYGTLRFVEGPLEPSSVRPDQILVLGELPDEVPVCAGIVSAQGQAPLGHLALLAATRGTPNMSLRGAMSDPALRALEGRLVRLEVRSQMHLVREASREEAERAWAVRRPARASIPPLDASARELREVASLRKTDASTVGAKAANLGEVCAIVPAVRTPGGFAIPFAHYLAHLERSGAAAELARLRRSEAFQTDARERARGLAAVRATIERAPVDASLLSELRARVAAFPGQPRVIFRSSTNAEDLPGFTGAGLYRSLVVPGGATEAQIADALRGVYASVWLEGAYEEREWYRVDHGRVAMGVLVQPFVDGAAVNAVAITANPFSRYRPAVFVNAQVLGGSVTGASGDEIPEQHLVYTYTSPPEPERISRSSRTGGEPVMSEAELVSLSHVLRRIHERFLPTVPVHEALTGTERQAVDVELLLAGPDREIVILQARPFTVRYHE